MKLFTIIIFHFLSLFSYSQLNELLLHASGSELPIFQNLNGDILQIDYKRYKGSQSTDSINEKDFLPNFNETFVFDSIGRVVEKNKTTAHIYYKFIYNSKNKLSEVLYSQSKDLEIFVRETLIYSDSGYYSVDTYANGERDSTVYFLNGLNQKTKRYSYRNSSIDQMQQLTYLYDSTNKLVEKKWYSVQGNLISTYSYKYRNDTLIKWSRRDKNNHINEIHEYQYNKFGDIIWEKVDQEKIYKTEYEYDNQNNWIKLIQYLNNKPQYTILREIKYK